MSPRNRGPRSKAVLVQLPENQTDPLISLAEQPDPLPLAALFGRQVRLDVEVGTGKGHTLEQLAREHPDRDYVGIEMGLKWARLTRARLIRGELGNVRLVHGDAHWVLERYLPAGSVHCYHIYFPDPWPKKRHAKRRLFRPELPPLLRRTLAEDGVVRVATDHGQYFEQIQQVMSSGGFAIDRGAAWSEDPVSSFEAKYREQGRAIHRAVYVPAAS